MVSTSLDDARLSSFHKRLAGYASGGAFLQGYVFSVTGVAMVQITPQLSLSAWQQGMVVGSTLVGGLPGAYLGGRLADKFGRQKLYTIVLAFTIVSSIASFWATGLAAMLVTRLLLGAAIGADFPVAQSLVGEFVPQRHRGRLLGIFLVTWFIGGVIGYVAGGLMLPTVGHDAWRWMVASSAVPGIAFVLLRHGTPESPRWLVRRGRVDEANEVIRKFFGPGVTLDELPEEEVDGAGFTALVRSGYLGRLIFTVTWWTCSVIPLFGIYGFGPEILSALHLNGGSGVAGSTALTAFFLVGAIVAVLVVNRMSRRSLIINSFAWGGIPLILIGIFSNVPAWLAVAAFAWYAVFIGGTQVLQAIYPVESFPTEIRGTALGMSMALVNGFTTIGTFLIPVAQNHWGVGPTVLCCGVLTLLGAAVCVRWAPETRGLRLEDAAALTQSPSEAVRPVQVRRS
jgi:putative MFS transporter